MSNYVGIDLGTTNSAICSYDGESTRLYKSPEQNDVTPSAIFFDRRGNKYVGLRAYNNAPRNPDCAAVLFKRLMGTKTPVPIAAIDQVMTPEECSAEILRTLFGYLPDEIRNNEQTGTVITVPAAFNQMQKDATLAAAEMAGIGRTALMQEPVAAIMAVMRERKTDGTFIVYDFGGGTLDIAIAESLAGRVTLLSHGGIAMCGGRDFDRAVLDNVVKPWLTEQFDLPEAFAADPKYRTVVTMATWAAERAKIELSSREETVISLSESELAVRDASGTEMYLDVPLSRSILNELIDERINESIAATRSTIEKAGLTPHDIERIVFVGGPTHYKPLRDKVSFELGIAVSTDVNPMTAVALGAAVFAESIDWSSERRGRKSSKGTISTGTNMEVTFAFAARTPGATARLVVKVAGSPAKGSEFQVDSMDTGWSSGRMPLRDGASLDLPLGQSGDNAFKIHVFDSIGGPVSLPDNRIVISRTAATIDAIPASSSVSIEVLDQLGGRSAPFFLVREGDALPRTGVAKFKAAVPLKAGSRDSINLNIWEGDIDQPISDNRPVGAMQIRGTDFDSGIIQPGAELICEYQIMDSGNIVLEVSVPSIGGTFHSGRNFYTRQLGEIDFTRATRQVIDEAKRLRERVGAVSSKVDDERLDALLDRLDELELLDESTSDPEKAKEAMDQVLEAKKVLAQVRKDHLKDIQQMDLESCRSLFDEAIRKIGRPAEITAFDNLTRTAERAIGTMGFDALLDEMKGRNFQILWRQDWFVADRFKQMADEPWRFPEADKHRELVRVGRVALQADDFDKLRAVVQLMYASSIGLGKADDMLKSANIVRG